MELNFFLSVSSKFVFDSDTTIVANASKEDEEFIKAVSDIMDISVRVMYELPLYRLFETKMVKDFKHAMKVRTLGALLIN